MDTPSTLLSLSLEEHKGGSGVHTSIYIHSLNRAQHIFLRDKIFLSVSELVVDISDMTVKPIIHYNLIMNVMGINPIQVFDAIIDDMNPDDVRMDIDDAKLMAYDFYYQEIALKGCYARYISAGLLDIERPVREGDQYLVCTIPSEMAQRAYKYAKAGCDWDTVLNRADPISAIRRLSPLGDFSDSIRTFDALISLFPDDVEMISRERGIFCLKSLQSKTQPRILSQHMRRQIDKIFEYTKTNHSEHIEVIEQINCDYTMGLMSGTFDSAGTFERGKDSDWEIWNLDNLLEKELQ